MVWWSLTVLPQSWASVGVAWPGLQCGSLLVCRCWCRPSTDPAFVGMPCLLGCGSIRFVRLCFDFGPSSLTLVLYRTRSYVVFVQPACRVYFPLHPARYEPMPTYLGPHSRRTHVPLVRHPPSLDIKANRNAPAIRRFGLGTSSKVTVYAKRCGNLANAVPALCQRRWWWPNIEASLCPCHLRNVICTAYHTIIECVQLDYTCIQSNIATSDYKLNN